MDYFPQPIADLNLFFLLAFLLSFLKPRREPRWRSLGLVTTFFADLFTGMFGFPLTIYLLTSLLGHAYRVVDPFLPTNGPLLTFLSGGAPGVEGLIMIVTSALFWWGIWILAQAWRQRHQAHSGLVTGGLYARVRHPQYLGLFLIIIALLLQWPTLITLLMAPVLFMAYRRVARREERVLIARFGEQYAEYRARVPAFVPRLWRKPRAARLISVHEMQINEK